MMTEEEQALYDALPKTVTIYRGTDAARCREGISWSLKRSEASRFPFLYRYRTRQPVLVRARVRKSRILAIKLDRGEFEVITFAAHARMTIPLCESDVMPMAAPDGGAG